MSSTSSWGKVVCGAWFAGIYGLDSCRIPHLPSLAPNYLIVHEGLSFVSHIVAEEAHAIAMAKSISDLADE